MPYWTVTLNTSEMRLCRRAAALQRIEESSRDANPGLGVIRDRSWEPLNHLRGACSQCAAGLAFNCYWGPQVGWSKTHLDVGGLFEVRSWWMRPCELVVKKKDIEDKGNVPFLLVDTTDLKGRNFRMVGWIWSYEAEERGEWHEEGRGDPAWFVKEGEKLRSNDELEAWILQTRVADYKRRRELRLRDVATTGGVV